ncbi:MAG: tRNA uridine-5-carboxymethylaminomethyl(34) synthesis GTPase MnmE [candidate division WOR-3 bacterium]
MRKSTICALATPPGFGSIAVIRVSGPDSFSILDRLCRRARPSRQPGWTVRLDWLLDNNGRPVDQVLLTVFRKPHSYTGEDMVEISCHGGIVTADRIMQLLLENGCRLAEPGEFTRRAVLNGKLTLSQAEAVLDLVNARTALAQAAALNRYQGELSSYVAGLSRRLRDLYAEVEFELGFEPDGRDPLPGRKKRVRSIIAELDRAIAAGERHRFASDGAHVAIVGRPNVGKSSLFNRLLEQDRALVSPLPGTTRDRVEARIVINGSLVHLSDTCGVPASTTSAITRLAVAQTERAIESADLILAVFDGSEPARAADRVLLEKLKNRATIYVVNKSDRPRRFRIPLRGPTLAISCRTGANLARLRMLLARRFRVPPSASRLPLANQRALQAFKEARAALQRSLSAPDLETAAFDIRAALDALAVIDAPITSTALLDSIFARFCIGK